MTRFAMCLLAVLVPGWGYSCGLETDCNVGDRMYRLYVPESVEGPTGAFFFAHGYRGSANGAMGNRGFMALADDLGLAFVALDAGAEDWNLAHRPSEPDQTVTREYDYVAAVIADMATRMELDSDRLVMTGFSAGGMMTWNIACGMGDAFAGFVPYSGTFWLEPPETCPTPAASVVHIHGTEDTTVPLGGRPIGPTRQGDVPDTLAMYAAYGDFTPVSVVDAPGDMSCAESANGDGRILDFCTFSGGHSFTMERVRYGIERVLSAE